MENKLIGLDGKHLKEDSKETRDYSSIKLSDIYQPRAFDVVVQEPFNFTQLLHKAQLMREENPQSNLDCVFEVVAVGSQVGNCKIGDKIMLKGGPMQPINLVSEFQYQINEDQVSGIVINQEYERIRKFFVKQREALNPAKGLNLRPMGMGYDNKPTIPGAFNPNKDLPN